MKTKGETSVNCDIVVIGAGATGLAAALTAVENGASVILFEKRGVVGGSSNFGEGIFAVETEMQRQQYVNYSRDDAFKSMMEYSHWRANPRLVRAFINESANTVSWMQGLGVEFVEAMTNMPGGARVWHVFKGPRHAPASVMIKVLAARAKEKGVDFQMGTPVKSLLKEKNRITGVIAQKDGQEVSINARAVIIGTGGYANNKDWIKKYTGFDLGVNIVPVGNIDKTGDGIHMAWEIGAAEEGISVLQLQRFGPVLGPGNPLDGPIMAASNQPNLFVNQDGERYCDESLPTNFPHDGAATARQKGQYSFVIFDEPIAKHWKEHGIEIGQGRVLPPGSRIDIEEMLKAALDGRIRDIFMADSIEGLAAKIGVNPGTLKATVDEYNGFCARGHDDLFAKDPKYLMSLKGPKFIAMKCHLAFISTLGGIKINHNMEVLDKNDEPIPGLFAGGNDVGGMYGDTYDLYESGTTLGFAFTSGRIAARTALSYIGK